MMHLDFLVFINVFKAIWKLYYHDLVPSPKAAGNLDSWPGLCTRVRRESTLPKPGLIGRVTVNEHKQVSLVLFL